LWCYYGNKEGGSQKTGQIDEEMRPWWMQSMFCEVESIDVVLEIAPGSNDRSRERGLGGKVVCVGCDRYESAESKGQAR